MGKKLVKYGATCRKDAVLVVGYVACRSAQYIHTVHTHICTYGRTYVFKSIHTYYTNRVGIIALLYTYVHTYVHTYIHTYIHRYTRIST